MGEVFHIQLFMVITLHIPFFIRKSLDIVIFFFHFLSLLILVYILKEN